MNFHFHKNSLKLAGIYLSILMVISLFFSGIVYQLSIQELDRSLRRPGPEAIINQLPNNSQFRINIDDYMDAREAEYQEAHDRILSRLIIINIFILIGGGILSYYFALKTLKPIEEAHEAQSRFTADASHELRTPIAAMQTETEVALMDPKLTLKKAKDILKSNIEELAKLTALSEGLLKLAHAETNGLPMSQISLKKISEEAVRRVDAQASKKKIKINHDTVKDVNLMGNETNLIEALTIILDNAIKYSPEKSTVTLTNSVESKTATIVVADNGIGIKSDEIPKIFDRFYRADNSRSKQNVSGYGIGLAIAKNIIDKHKGKISAQSQPNKGSTFTIQLPRSA